jgi:hypothetical protein
VIPTEAVASTSEKKLRERTAANTMHSHRSLGASVYDPDCPTASRDPVRGWTTHSLDSLFHNLQNTQQRPIAAPDRWGGATDVDMRDLFRETRRERAAMSRVQPPAATPPRPPSPSVTRFGPDFPLRDIRSSMVRAKSEATTNPNPTPSRRPVARRQEVGIHAFGPTWEEAKREFEEVEELRRMKRACQAEVCHPTVSSHNTTPDPFTRQMQRAERRKAEGRSYARSFEDYSVRELNETLNIARSEEPGMTLRDINRSLTEVANVGLRRLVILPMCHTPFGLVILPTLP